MAGNTRFHNKYHFAQHHSEVTDKNSKYPEATTDPIASQDFPFQGKFYSDGVLKIHSQDPDDFNYLHNNTTVGGNLTVDKDTLIKGDLEVIGNVLLRADPNLGERVIQIGNDLEGGEFDVVRFRAFVDSHFSPDYNDQHDLGDPDHFWRRLYTDNLTLKGELMVGDCTDTPFRGMYINNNLNKPGGSRLGINTCEPKQELHVIGDALISENTTVEGDIEGFGNLRIHKNADIDGVLTLKDGNPIRWQDNNHKIYHDGDRIVIDTSNELEINASHIDLSNQAVTVDLIDSVNAYCVENGLFGFDAKNRRVGIHTCDPVADFHNNAPHTRFDNTTTTFEISDTYTINVVNAINTTTDAFDLTTDTVTRIESPTLDLDTPVIKLDTQTTKVNLKPNETDALDVHDCLLLLDTANRYVGINNCDPQADLHVKGDLLLEGGSWTGDYDNINLSAKVVKIESTDYTLLSGGNVGVNVIDPQHALSIPCGDTIGTHHVQGATTINNRIKFCENVNNTEGWDDMVIITDGKSDVKFKPGRSVQIPDRNLAIGTPYNNSHPDSSLEVRGNTHLLGEVIIESSEQDGKGQDRFNIHSLVPTDIGTSVLNSARLTGGIDNNIVFHLNSQTVTAQNQLQPGFGIVYNNHGNVGFKTGFITASYNNTTTGDYNAFVGVDTSSHVFVDTVAKNGDDKEYLTNFRVNGFTVLDGDTWVNKNLHVNADQTIDGKLQINCTGDDGSADAIGLKINYGNITLSQSSFTGQGDHETVIESKKNKFNKTGADDLGSHSNYATVIAGATQDHVAIDLRNTANDQRFAVRYSSANDGVADKIGLMVGHYDGEAHVGIGGVPTQGNHLHVFGDTRITGNITIEGDQSSLQTSDLIVEDAHITLNSNPTQTSSTSNLLSAGIWFQGDNDDIVGYVRVTDDDLSQLVAKAPTGQELYFDVNGNGSSMYRSEESTIDIADTQITTIDTTMTIGGVNQGPVVVDIDADLTVEAKSWINQDLTTDSINVQFHTLAVNGIFYTPTVTDPQQTSPGSVANPKIRFNYTTNRFEGYKNQWWVPLDQTLSDNNLDTYVKANDDDTVDIYCKDKHVVHINENGINLARGRSGMVPLASKYMYNFNNQDIVVMPGDKLVRGFNIPNTTAPYEATQAEMEASDIITGNKYLVLDHLAEDSLGLVVQVFDGKRKAIIPDEIHIINDNRICIDVTSFPDLGSTGNGTVMIII